MNGETSKVDYERQGVKHDVVHESLEEQLKFLEDRHVGLRHDVIHDMERIENDVDNLDESLRHEVEGLRREITSLTSSTVQAITDLQKELSDALTRISNLEALTQQEQHQLNGATQQ